MYTIYSSAPWKLNHNLFTFGSKPRFLNFLALLSLDLGLPRLNVKIAYVKWLKTLFLAQAISFHCQQHTYPVLEQCYPFGNTWVSCGLPVGFMQSRVPSSPALRKIRCKAKSWGKSLYGKLILKPVLEIGHIKRIGSRDIPIGIETCYWLDGRGSTHGRIKLFISASQRPDRLPDPPSVRSNRYQGFPLGINRLDREADHVPSSSA
jgi:hypothetical protein